MAASKKSTNSTKTAHVMNLLSKNRPAESVADEASTTETPVDNNQPATAPQPSPSISPIMASLAPDATVSTQIKSALEDALLSEVGEPTAEPVAEPVVESTPEPMAEPAFETAVEQTEDSNIAPIPEPVSVVKKEAPKLIHVNVMQILVDEIADKYIEMFGLCNCPHCVTDVKALALNNLTPKYVVMHEGEMVPRITLYEHRFKSYVVAQILNACKVVAGNPHHER